MEFDLKLKNTLSAFRNAALSKISEGIRKVPRGGEKVEVNVTEDKVRSGLTKVSPARNFENYKKSFFEHFSEINKHLVFCSSPQSFRSAWNLRSEKLSNFDAEKLISEGAQLIPVNEKSRVFSCEEQGVLYGPDRRLILGVRHSEGNYDDSLNQVAEFDYQPPTNCAGFLTYRFCHYLSYSLDIPYIILVIMWFEYRINDELNQVFIISPAKIINKKNQLTKLNDNLHKPLKLQLIDRKEAAEALFVLESRKDNMDDITFRAPLNESLAREWSYNNISNVEKGRKIKRWAKTHGKKCPGSLCQNRPFADIQPFRIAFGHIISQKWSKAFTYLLKSIHHPDNLYLTCSNCNSSLSDKFPNSDLRDRITRNGTIGDWLRANEKQIRSS